jgi:Putative transposase DNA-binding domain
MLPPSRCAWRSSRWRSRVRSLGVALWTWGPSNSRYKSMLSGKDLVILDERDTSKTCSGCGHKQPMPLWKRTYRCPNADCRLVMDRDENSAVNILKRFFARRGCAVVRSNVSSSQTRRIQWNILELMPYLTSKDEGKNSMALKH